MCKPYLEQAMAKDSLEQDGDDLGPRMGNSYVLSLQQPLKSRSYGPFPYAY
jgi:hypothetical protein